MNWQKVKRDLLLAFSSHFLYKVVGYFILMILTRYVAKGELGEFFFAATLANSFVLFTELGINTQLTREVAEKPEKAVNYFSEVISLRIPLFALYFIVLNLFTFIFKPELITIVLLTSIYTLLEEFYYSFGSLFLGLKRLVYNVITGVSTKLLLFGLIFVVVSTNASLIRILACYILANMLMVSIASVIFWRKIGRPRLLWNMDSSRKILKTSFPFFALTVFGLLNSSINTLFLGFMQTYAAVATFQVAFKLLEASGFLIRPISMIFFPLFSEMGSKLNWQEIHRIYRKMLLFAGAIGSAITFIVLMFAGFIIPILFGPKYDDSILIVQILFLLVPLRYMGTISGFLANSIHLEKKVVSITIKCVIIGIVISIVIIPLWGTVGAAIASVISGSIRAIWIMVLNFRELRSKRSTESFNILGKEWDHA